MDSIQDFIKQAAGQIGVSEQSAGSATGGLLQMIREKAGDVDANELLSKVPGASALLEKTAAPVSSETGAGGMLGGLISKAGDALGGGMGSALGVMGLFKQAGLGTEQVRSFVPLFFNFVKSKAGASLVGRVLEQIPELKKLLG